MITPYVLSAALAAAPADEDATKWTPGLEVFAQYGYRKISGDSWFHEFTVPRAWMFLDVERGKAHGRVLAEGVRSSSEGSLLGVSGDSIVLRLREAWGGYRPVEQLDVRAGLVPTLVVPLLDQSFALRVLGPSQAEAAGLLSPADLGVTLRTKLPNQLGDVAAGVYDGDGYTSRELNRGKTSEIALTVRPIESLAILLAYQVGSVGTTSTRANRGTAGLFFTNERVHAGVAATYALGLYGDGSRKALATEASVRVNPISDLLLAARFQWLLRDTSQSADATRVFLLGAGWQLDRGLEAWIAGVRDTAGSIARAALPASDQWELRVALRAAF